MKRKLKRRKATTTINVEVTGAIDLDTNPGLSLEAAIRKAGRFGAIRNEKFVRVEFTKDGKPTRLYDGRWIRPQNMAFSDEAILTPGWEFVQDCCALATAYNSNFALAI